MTDNNKMTEQLEEAIGGAWTPTTEESAVQGFSAHFPKFRSDAIVGVINAAAEHCDAKERAVAFSSGAASDRMGNDPSAPREVIIPKGLAENSRCQEALTSDMKQTITNVVSQQLSHGASQGLHSR